MGNHYVPRYYLKGFSTLDNPEQVYLYRKGSTNSVRTNVINVGQENDLYPDELETKITQEVEEIAKPILEKIRNFQVPTLDEFPPNNTNPSEHNSGFEAVAQVLGCFKVKIPGVFV